jgi:hypothetical protein
MMMPRTLGETETIEHFEKIECDLRSQGSHDDQPRRQRANVADQFP